jgi:glutathione S-transferase
MSGYTLYIANRNYSSWSLRPWVLMRTLGLDFEERLIPFANAGEPNRLPAISPTGRVPCLHHGELRVWDSLAIVEYLAERHPGVWPTDPTARTWARCAAAEMHSGFGTLRSVCSMTCGQRVVLRERPAALETELQRLRALWTEGLTRFGGPFLADVHGRGCVLCSRRISSANLWAAARHCTRCTRRCVYRATARPARDARLVRGRAA